MLRKYVHGTRSRRNSSIQDNDKTFDALSIKPMAGYTADTRFFGPSNTEKVLVVKRPKYNLSNEDDRKKIDDIYANAYKREQNIWNEVYPTNKAHLFTEYGLRLVLPYLPGENLSRCISENPLTRCQQLLSVAHAVKTFHQLGYNYTDFNADNVLIHEKSDGSFQAYLIDFDAVFEIKRFRTNHELLILNGLIGNISQISGIFYNTIDTYIEALNTEIERLQHLGSLNESSDRISRKTALL